MHNNPFTLISLQNGASQGTYVFKHFENGFEQQVEDLSTIEGPVLIASSHNPINYGDNLSGTVYDMVPKTFIGWYFRIFMSLIHNHATPYVTPEAIKGSYHSLGMNYKKRFYFQNEVIKDEKQFIDALKSGMLLYEEDHVKKPVLDFEHADVKLFMDHLIWKSECTPVMPKTIEADMALVHTPEKKKAPYIRFLFTTMLCSFSLYMGYRYYQKGSWKKAVSFK